MKGYVDFDNPPVVETVLSVSFAPLDGFMSAHIGGFWREIENEFPKVAERSPYEMPTERLGAPHMPQIEFRVGPLPSKTRSWLISENDERLIQLQSDWFAYNWRKRVSEYDHYEQGRENFETYFRKFETYLKEYKLGTVSPTQCEVTYVNHIATPSGGHGDLADVLTVVNPPQAKEPATELESSQLSLSFALQDAGETFGRLHATASPSFHEGSPLWILNLTARGVPLGSGLDGVLRFFDEGRKAIVTNFKALTTDEMHKRWGLR